MTDDTGVSQTTIKNTNIILYAGILAISLVVVAKAQTLGEAINTMMDQETKEAIKAGGSVHPGQFGQTVFQYKDHYKTCGPGLGCVVNSGKWFPLQTATHTPSAPGELGELIFDPQGFPRWMFDGTNWIDMKPSSGNAP